MKVFLLSSFARGDYGNLIYLAFRDIGCKVFPFDYRKQLELFGEDEMNYRLAKSVLAWEPDVLFATKAEWVRRKTIELLPCRKILWFPDVETRYARFEIIRKAFDEVYTMLEGRGIPTLYPAAYPPVHREVKLEGKELWMYRTDCVFVGTAHLRRVKQFRELVKGLNVRMKVWGNGWPKDFPYYAGGPRYFTELSKAISGGKVSINFHYNWPNTPNIRAFEVTACKRCLISEEGKGLNECFEPGKEYVPFETVDEARKLVRYYIRHKEQRKRIAEKGYKRCMQDHLLTKRLRRLLKK